MPADPTPVAPTQIRPAAGNSVGCRPECHRYDRGVPRQSDTTATESAHFTSVGGTRFSSVEWHDEIDSTNTELLERARRGAPEGIVLIADVQTAGRGRRGRRWTAPPGTSLMMSVLLRPPSRVLPPPRAALVTMAVALAAIDACERVSGVRPSLKWPNDLVIAGAGPGDRKLAGILAESLSTEGELTALVVGMGLNTGWPAVPDELDGIATSLNLESGTPVDRALLAHLVLEGLEQRYAGLCSDDHGAGEEAASLLAEACHNSATLGRRVRISFDETSNGGALEGVAGDLDAEGRLLVSDDAGLIHSVSVGDVVHLRPTS